MKPLLPQKTRDYQARCLERWAPLIEAAGTCNTEAKKLNTALVLESTQSELYTESYSSTPDAMGGGAASPGVLGTSAVYPTGTVTDYRVPQIVIPTLTRVFPELIAHDLVGVQPMDGPVGMAFAYRKVYGKNRAGEADSTTNRGQEIGVDLIDDAFSGATGLVYDNREGQYSSNAHTGAVDPANAYWASFNSTSGGRGADMETAEWWRIHEDWPTAEFKMEKGVIEAKTRKLASSFSLELQEDLMKMHGVDIDSESVKMLQWDVKAGLDRQLLGEIVKSTIDAANTSTWDPVTADGRNQIERIGTLYTHILLKSQQIAVNTKRGSANWCVTTPTVVALMERLRDYTGFQSSNVGGSSAYTNVDGGVAKVGYLRQDSISLYRDTFAPGNYILLGYKGMTEYDTGIVYCPYIPLQIHRALGDGSDFNPRIGVRTRYGVLNNLFGSGNYSQIIRVINLDQALSGTAVFLAS